MKRLLVIPVLYCLFFSCTPEEEKFTFDSTASLRFSADTVYFDTLFSTIGSVTKRFRVYNDAENAVNISSVSLGSGSGSSYSIFVNGIAGPEVENVRLLGKDSLLVLAEVTIDPQDQDLPFVVSDQVNFNTNGNLQSVELVSWGQDANFLRDSVLVCNTTWTAEKPYVLYNSVLIEEGCTLTVEEGTRIYSHNGSFIFIQGTILANGTAENRVTFTNDRFDEQFADAPGQWGGLIFLVGSNSNQIDFADIRNANVGIYLGTPDDDDEPDLRLTNTRIENMGGNELIPSIDSLVQPGFGLLAISSDLYAANVLINNCQLNAVGNLAGGNYTYEHCTFANFSFNFFRRDPVLVLSDNLLLGDNSVLLGALNFSMTNSIIWGSLRDELLISNSGETSTEILFANNILKSQNNAFADVDNLLNEDPKFFDPGEFNFQLDTLSPAKDTAIDLGILIDLEGTNRDNKPDIGAFERKEN
ncbi:MAG: right-handed parallel beta-helix repeat-containing protein [Fulvivirga sp.]